MSIPIILKLLDQAIEACETDPTVPIHNVGELKAVRFQIERRMVSGLPVLNDEEKAMLDTGVNPIEMIRAYNNRTKVGLYRAKMVYDRHLAENPYNL